MAFSFRRGEPVPRAVRRVVTEQLDYAAAQLRKASPASRDEAIHEARKSIKKVRSVLRLMYRELGPVADTANVLLRDLARRLSAHRDASVMVETVDCLKDDLHPGLLAPIRARMVRERTRAARAPVPATVPFALEQISGRVRAWPLRATGFAALEPGLRRSYHRARKAMAAAARDPHPDSFHEWRKRVKDHWYHLRLLDSVQTDATRAYEKNLKELETLLGDDHNFAVLRERIAARPDAEALLDVFAAIDRRQLHLREQALRLGERLYAQKSREFVAHISELLGRVERPAVRKPKAPAA